MTTKKGYSRKKEAKTGNDYSSKKADETINRVLTVISIVVTTIGLVTGVSLINNRITAASESVSLSISNLDAALSNTSVQQMDQTVNIITSSAVSERLQPIFTDYYEKAKVGDVAAQLWLAEHYISIGNYNDAIYWYKIIVDQSTASEKEISIAYNNLGWLYVNGYGLTEYDPFSSARYQQAFLCFKTAGDFELEIGTENAIETVKLPSFIDYGDYSAEIHAFTAEHGVFLYDESVVDSKGIVKSQYFSFYTFHGQNYTYRNFHCIYSGTSVVMVDNHARTQHDYYGAIYSTDGQVENCKLYKLQ